MTKRSDRLANEPIFKLVLMMGLPAVFSMIIQALYNVVDTIYISNYSQDAMFAIGIVYPLQIVGLSVALGTGIGVGSLVSRKLGEQNYHEAEHVATTGIFLTIFHWLLLALVGIFFTKPFLSGFSSDPEIIEMADTYISLILILSIGQGMSILFERILQAQGNMVRPMFGVVLAALTNIILDPIFIFGWGPIPDMGILGAAIATIIGQFVGMFINGYGVLFKSHDIHISFKDFSFDKDIIKMIYNVGIPTTIMNMIGSVTATCLNSILVQYGENAVTSLSLYFKLQTFVFMPVFGFNQGTLPILAYNYGAQNPKRYLDTVKVYLSLAAGVMFIGTCAFRLMPETILSIFEMDNELRMMAARVISIISLSFIPAAFNIVSTTILQSFGKGMLSMMQSMIRQLIMLIPFAFILSKAWGLYATFFAYPLSEILVLLIYVTIIIKAYHKAFGGKHA